MATYKTEIFRYQWPLNEVENSKRLDSYIKQYSDQGYELFNITPLLNGEAIGDDDSRSAYTFTDGLFLFFRKA